MPHTQYPSPKKCITYLKMIAYILIDQYITFKFSILGI